MACELNITSVIPAGTPGQPVSSIAVAGTAVDCDGVVVQISCGFAEKLQSVSVNAGQWQANFTDMAGTGCVCGDPGVALRVVAYCKDQQNCLDTRTLAPIPCGTLCPTIHHIDAVVPQCGAVLAAGQYEVTFNAYIDGTGVTQCFWNFGDGTFVPGTLPAGGVATATHAYSCPGEYEVSLLILSECEPDYFDSEVRTLELPFCGCPTVSSFSATAVSGNPCRWIFEAKIGGAFAQCVETFVWSFGDGATDQTDVPVTEHIYADDGDYNVTLTMVGVGQADGGPCSYAQEITVSNCHDGNGGGGGNGHSPCPWWNPFCKGWGLCAIILLLALASILSTAGLSFWAGCTGNPVAIAATIAAAVAGIVLILLWVALCSKIKSEFCEALNALINIMLAILAAQPVVLILMWLLGVPLTCIIGAITTFAYYGSLLAYLFYIKDAKC